MSFLATCGVMLMTGWPQRTLVESAARQALGARLEVEGLALLGAAARADRIRLYPISAGSTDVPLMEARGVTLHYGALISGPRRLARLDIDALNIHLDGRDPARTNFAFLTDLLAKPQSDSRRDATALLPEIVAVKGMSLRAAFPAMDVAVGRFAMRAAIHDARNIELKAAGANLQGDWRVESQNAAGVFDDGRVNAVLELKNSDYRTHRAEVFLPGFLELLGSAEVRAATSNAPAALEVDLERFVLEGADLSHARWSFLPFPLKFGHVDMSDSHARLVQTPHGLMARDARIAVSAQRVAFGVDGKEWFTGDVAVLGQSREGEHELTVTFGQGQTVTVRGTGALDDVHAHITTDAWSRDQLAEILPKALPPILDWAPTLRSLSGAAEVTWRPPDYTLDVQLAPVLGKDAVGDARAKGSGTVGDGRLTFEGAASVAWAGGTMAATLGFLSRDQFTIEARLERVDLRTWLPLAPPLPLPETLRGVVSGHAAVTCDNRLAVETDLQLGRLGARGNIDARVKASATAPSTRSLRPLNATGTVAFPAAGGSSKFSVTLPEGGGYNVRGDLDRLDAAAVVGIISTSTFFDTSGSKVDGTIQLESEGMGARGSVMLSVAPSPLPQFFVPAGGPVHVTTRWRSTPGFEEFAGDKLILDIGDGATFALTDWSLRRAGMALKGLLAGGAPVARLAPLRGLPGLEGVVTLTAPIDYRNDTIVMDFTAEGEELGYGPYAAPPGVPVEATGRLTYETTERKGRVEKPVITWTDSTKVVLETMNFTTTPELAPTSFTLTTDLAPLVLWGLVQEAEGSATVTGTVRYADHTPMLDAAYRVHAPTLVLPGKLAVLGGVAADGRLGHGEGLTAEGRVGAATVTAAGALLHDVRGPFAYDGLKLTGKGLTGTLWGGRLVAEIDAHLGEPTRPVNVQAAVEDLDLARFTQEYKPPRTSLTGLGDGTVNFTWSKEGFSDFDADLKCSRGVSVNWDLVYQLLMSQYVKEAKGGKKLDQIVSDVVGKGDQRAFDSGRLVLEMGAGERIEGDALLKSKALNLTIDIRMDPEALAQLLVLRQEANLDRNISGIRTDPIELRN